MTKSVRLSPEESELLAEVSAREHLAQGSLSRKCALDALERARLEQAIADYTAGEFNLTPGEFNLGETASRAGVTVSRLLTEPDSRGIDAIGPAHFRTSLGNPQDLLGGSEELPAAIRPSDLCPRA